MVLSGVELLIDGNSFYIGRLKKDLRKIFVVLISTILNNIIETYTHQWHTEYWIKVYLVNMLLFTFLSLSVCPSIYLSLFLCHSVCCVCVTMASFPKSCPVHLDKGCGIILQISYEMMRHIYVNL